MAEDVKRPEDANEVEEEAEPEDIVIEEEKSETPSRFKRPTLSNPLGLIFNLRMLRRVVQILFFVAINGYIFAAWWGLDWLTDFWTSVAEYLPTLPIIAPLEAPFAVMAGSFDTMLREFTSASFPFFTLGAMLIILVILGRSACGWICPIGTIQDFATLPNRNKIRPAPGTENELRRLKAYVFFFVVFLALWVGVSRALGTADALIELLGPLAVAPFDPFNPAYIIFVLASEQVWPTGFDSLWILQTWGVVFWLQLIFAVLVAIVAIWFPRWFCRWLCPAGWFYGIFSRDALIGIGRNPALCTPDTCNVCEVVCPMNIRIRKFPYQHMHSADCIMCLECKSHCPNNAIVFRFA
jgi:polyferredoxin